MEVPFVTPWAGGGEGPEPRGNRDRIPDLTLEKNIRDPQEGGALASTVAIALGANLGDPGATLAAVRPLLAAEVRSWAAIETGRVRLLWSPLFLTTPEGGPPGQPAYLNAVLLIESRPEGGRGSPWPAPAALLERLQLLEARFGRVRSERWGPRHLDLDLLWCGDVRCRTPALELPHPRLVERRFVLAPLAAIDPLLVLPQRGGAAERLAALPARPDEAAPQPLPGRPGWPEGP
jgi:2-amino-4-hydroxy-6-hydroxymethyldihydropteridine diphosphokinase